MTDIWDPIAKKKMDDLYGGWWWDNEMKRMEQARVRDVWFQTQRDDVEAEIKKILSEKYGMHENDIEKTHKLFEAGFRKDISRLAVVYHEKPDRKVMLKNGKEHSESTEYMQYLYKKANIDLNLKQSNKLTLVHNSNPVRVIPMKDKWDELYIDIRSFSPQFTMAKPTKESYLVPETMALIETGPDGKVRFKAENKEWIRTIDNYGNVTEEKNTADCLRWAISRNEIGQDMWSGINADEMVVHAESNAINITSIQQTIAYQMFGIPVLINCGFEGKESIRLSPNEPVVIEGVTADMVRPSVEWVTPNTNIKTVAEYMKQYGQTTALNRNIPPDLEGILVNSGYQVYLLSIPLQEARKEQLHIFYALEHDIFQIVKRIVNSRSDFKFTFPEDATISVNFKELRYENSEIEDLNVIEKKINLGLDSVVEYLKRKDPDKKDEELLKEVQKRVAEANMLKSTSSWSKILLGKLADTSNSSTGPGFPGGAARQ